MKVATGADFIITQMFFDNRYLYDFLDRSAKAGINVPILAGIMPIADINKTQEFCVKCGATLPRRIIQRFDKAGSSAEEMKKIGTEVVTEQCADLMAQGVKYFHFYTLNQSQAVMQIIRDAGLLGLRK